MNPLKLEAKIEAVLFWKGESIGIKKLASILEVSDESIVEALGVLRSNLVGRGMVLIEHNDEVMLGTAPELSDLFEKLQKEELNKDLSKASLETLSIILYKNGATRGEVDYIRGVNSTFTLRALSVRGLIEKVEDPKDSRKILWRPSLELLSYMGVTKVSELPEYEELVKGFEEAKGIENKDVQ